MASLLASVSSINVFADPEKTKIVESWPVPTNVKELRIFMGFCGYYRKFIQNFSKLAKCLHRLTEKQLSYKRDDISLLLI
jgi:hypothetical protein